MKRFSAKKVFALGLLALLLFLIPALSAQAAWKVEIVKLKDGDSLVVRYLGGRPEYGLKKGQKVQVRLKGIDAPEYRQAGGAEAAKALAAILAGGDSWSLEPMGRDQYGRVVGMLYVNGPDGRQWVNLLMVEKGHAWVYRKYTRSKRLRSAESLARREKRGLWADKNPEPPWKYRARHRHSSRGRR